jgi:hypothetical protein
MSTTFPDDQEFMEENLTEALQEAWDKANIALSAYSEDPPGSQKKLWFAAEAADYSSLLFALTYQLEDFDPPVATKSVDTRGLVNNGVQSLRQAIAMRTKSPKEAYARLRIAVTCLRKAHLETIPKRKRRYPPSGEYRPPQMNPGSK